MNLYLQYVKMNLKSLLQYKANFIISILTQMVSSLFSIVSIYFLFDRFGNIEGYTFQEIIICFAVSYFGFSLAECFFRGFDQFSKMLANGEFDRIMVRPKSLIFQTLGAKMQFVKVGRFGLSLAVLIILIIKMPILHNFNKIILIFLMAIGTTIIYGSLFMLKAGICFFTTQGLEIMNIFTDGARELAQYPLRIFKKEVFNFFTFIIPLTLVNYYPFLYLIERSKNMWLILLPILSGIFIVPCYIVWAIGVRKYKSIGS